MESSNPYTTPEANQSGEIKPLNSELRDIVIGWERMRVLYNIILFLVGVIAIFVIMREPFFKLEDAVYPALAFGVLANVCFCAGPMVETYIRVIFNNQDVKSLRMGLFVLGTLFSLIPAFIAISSAGSLLFF